MMSENETINPITLNDAVTDMRYKVLAVEAKGAVRQRMLDMGLVPGVSLAVIRFAPLGDPIEIRINRFLMSLRREEAKDVIVTEIGPVPHRDRDHLRKGRGFGRMRHFHGRGR
jgi:Fe2+ transport system protein FeoA